MGHRNVVFHLAWDRPCADVRDVALAASVFSRGVIAVQWLSRPQGNWARDMWVFCAVLVGVFFLIVFASGCARRIPEPVGGRAASPHVGWVIMSGDADNPDRDFVCQSNPRSECVVPVDRPDARVLSDVHFYYHAASTETKYTGSIRIGFFDAPHEINPSITVKPGESPGNQSVADFVSMRSGTYTMSMAIVATPSQT
ncbi:MAG: hypothetical protein Q7J25_14205, partial [Vicinamibacterales bacterium]|nr:hypothetical protein [Vicinamibacterales bacterium]